MQDFKHYKQGLIEIDKIKPYKRNAKIHNSLQLEQIKNSILEFGFTNPLIVDSDLNLIAGHGRLEALKMLNRVDFKDDLEKRQKFIPKIKILREQMLNELENILLSEIKNA